MPPTPGAPTKTTTTVVTGDRKKEVDEAIYPDRFGNSGSSLFTEGCGTGRILNDDWPGAEISPV